MACFVLFKLSLGWVRPYFELENEGFRYRLYWVKENAQLESFR